MAAFVLVQAIAGLRFCYRICLYLKVNVTRVASRWTSNLQVGRVRRIAILAASARDGAITCKKCQTGRACLRSPGSVRPERGERRIGRGTACHGLILKALSSFQEVASKHFHVGLFLRTYQAISAPRPPTTAARSPKL